MAGGVQCRVVGGGGPGQAPGGVGHEEAGIALASGGLPGDRQDDEEVGDRAVGEEGFFAIDAPARRGSDGAGGEVFRVRADAGFGDGDGGGGGAGGDAGQPGFLLRCAAEAGEEVARDHLMGGPYRAEARAAPAGDEGAFGRCEHRQGGAVAAAGERQADAEEAGIGHCRPEVGRHGGAEAAPGDAGAGKGEAEVFLVGH